jgi:signal transduction histidine kinase
MTTAANQGRTVLRVMTTVRRLLAHSGLWLWLQVALLEFLVIGGTIGNSRGEAANGFKAVDAVSIALLFVIALAARGTPARWRFWGFAVAVAGTVAYTAADYNTHGPIVVAMLVALLRTVDSDRPRRSILLGSLMVLLFGAASVAAQGPNAFIPAAGGLLPLVAAFLGIGHALLYRRAQAEDAKEAEAQRRLTEERLRIARELHDVVSHSISVINVQAGAGAYVIGDQPEKAREALLAIKATSKEALRELHGILGVLRDESGSETKEPAPGIAQLPALIDISQRAGVAATLSVRGEARPLAPTSDLAAYRIVQESLTNVLRHAGPASADVKVTYENGHVVIEIVDDGGMASAVHGESAGGGYGIAGMRERAAAAGGAIETGPRLGRGFRVRASLPVEAGDS